ncbi:helix-turn-helix domain-containing protein [Streptomyces sp900105245]|uniref:Helix-turn-helix domain-containing protein n=1 Tax=Streptomyces sp. 900105245 TaxID=3154379 RepID=A0ABV1UB16_9ACTN
MGTALPPSHKALKVPEVMEALGLSRSKVYDLIRTRQLRSYTSGRARRVPVDAVRQYMYDRMEEAA